MGVFQCSVFQHSVFQNDCSGGATSGGVSGGFASGWQALWKLRKEIENPQPYPGASAEYLRLLKKLRMYEEQLNLANNAQARIIEARIKEIQLQLLGMK